MATVVKIGLTLSRTAIVLSGVDRHDMADPSVSSWVVLGTHDVADIVNDAFNNYQKCGTVIQDVQCTLIGSNYELRVTSGGGSLKVGTVQPLQGSMYAIISTAPEDQHFEINLHHRKCEPYAPQTILWRLQSNGPN
jgi:hypothetical protein